MTDIIKQSLTELVKNIKNKKLSSKEITSAFIDRSAEEFIEQIGKNGFIIVNGECSYGISFIIDGSKICMSGNK